MDLNKLSKTELLSKCEEFGIKKYKSKNKSELIELINSKKSNEKISERVVVHTQLNIDTFTESKVVISNIKIDNSKLINQINQCFHNKGVKQEERFNILMILLENIKNNIIDDKYNDIISLLNQLDYDNYDLIQELFMIIGSKYTKFNLDQFYTPLTISKFISQFMDVGDDKNAIDPAGGTGDLLLLYKGNKTIWDIDENALKLCKFNYELNKQVNYNLVCKNSLENFEDSISMYSYSVMNPPFGSNTIITDETILNKFELGKEKKKQEIGVLFLELGLKLLKEDGLLFIIVPAGYVGNSNKTCSEMRDLILKNRLIASISLPENTFKRSGTGVNTYLLIIQKKSLSSELHNIFISNVNNIGYNLTKKETPLKYKIIKETGEIIVDNKNKPVLDNDLDELYGTLCNFMYDNNLLGITKRMNSSNYEYINKHNLSFNILDIKRYLQIYLSLVNNLKSLNAIPLKLLADIITTPTKIEKTKLYKYIDISEINTPLYGFKALYGWELPSRAKYALKKYDILVSKLEGNLSYCVILDDNDNYIATNGVSVIRPKKRNDVYVIFENIMSNKFKCQHNAYLTGSIMASISDDDIEEILIDDKTIDINTTKKILETLETLQHLRI
jgi:type I restriction-modification system DNA methylase subunit